MLYSIAPASLLVINLILNWDTLKKYGFFVKEQDENKRVAIRYNQFILASGIYIFVDMSWGIMYEHHDIPVLFLSYTH